MTIGKMEHILRLEFSSVGRHNAFDIPWWKINANNM